MPRRAQTALEYLMTYGWALLIIAIVAIALWKLGVFSPATREGVSRQPDPFFIDYRTVSLDTSGNFKFTLLNGAGSSVNVTKIEVYEGGAFLGNYTTPTEIPVNGQHEFTVPLRGSYRTGDLHTFEVRIQWEYTGTGVTRTSIAVVSVRVS